MKNISKTTYFHLQWTRFTLLIMLAATSLVWGQALQSQQPNPATSTGPANPATGTGAPNPAMNGNNPNSRLTPGQPVSPLRNGQTNGLSRNPPTNTGTTNAVPQNGIQNGTQAPNGTQTGPRIAPPPTPQTATNPTPAQGR